MKCARCGQEFDSTIAILNAEIYHRANICACPNCGKAYCVKPITHIQIKALPDEMIENKKCDDWGEYIVTDKNYKKKED